MGELSDWTRNQRDAHDAGSAVGRPPWGYEIVGYSGQKVFAPTPAGRRWVPVIFAWVADGYSLPRIAEMLADEGVRSGAPDGLWHENTLRRMISSSTYTGLRVLSGRVPLPVEPLVSSAVQAEALDVLASRGGSGSSKTVRPKALLAKLRCGDPDCPGRGDWPMYRWSSKRLSYRCAGKGPGRKGCGSQIRLEVLDNAVLNRCPHLRALDLDQQRAFLANRSILAWKVGEVIHLKIDGRLVQVRA